MDRQLLAPLFCVSKVVEGERAVRCNRGAFMTNRILGTYFAAPYPARACVEVAALPKGVHVEMDAIVRCE